MMRISKALALAVALSCALPSNAYEDDVHYGLTLWLAKQAGFLDAEAETIATADVEIDHSGAKAVSLVLFYSCISKDKVMSGIAGELHFPPGHVPAPASQRVVTPGEEEALRASTHYIEKPTKPEESNLGKFGYGLHPLQDSWSHQGVPDIPTTPWEFCSPTLSWGHPEARGGFDKHEADWTWKYPDDAMKMARGTYKQLCKYQKELRGRPCGVDFQRLSEDVKAFISSETKAEKAQWLNQRKIDGDSIVAAITIKNGAGFKSKYSPPDYTAASLRPVPLSRFTAPVANSSEGFMRAFFTAWLTERDMSSVVDRFVESSGYRGAFGEDSARVVDPLVLAAQLRFWRVRDHGGIVASPLAATHDLTRLTRGQIADIPSLAQDEPYQTLEDALLPLSASGTPLLTEFVGRRDGRKSVVGIARLRHAPYELVIVMADYLKSGLKVTTVTSVIDN